MRISITPTIVTKTTYNVFLIMIEDTIASATYAKNIDRYINMKLYIADFEIFLSFIFFIV